MKTQPRIFVSVPDDRHMDNRRRSLKRAIIKFVAERGFDVVGFEPEQYGAGLHKNLDDWTLERADRRIRRCDGVLVVALARNQVHLKQPVGYKKGSAIPLATPYNHLEGALGMAQRLPMFILFEQDMDKIGIFNSGIKPAMIPRNADKEWVKSNTFREHFDAWNKEVLDRRDVFLGYCSKADSPANEIRVYLEKKGFSVLDWSRDFKSAGATILEEIERAASRCRCAVFLFTKDDDVAKKATGEASFKAIPRDNVLLEAGYFTQARGKGRVAIIREKGAKMPADFGGIIYLSMENRHHLLPIKQGLVKFLKEAL